MTLCDKVWIKVRPKYQLVAIFCNFVGCAYLTFSNTENRFALLYEISGPDKNFARMLKTVSTIGTVFDCWRLALYIGQVVGDGRRVWQNPEPPSH